MTKHSHLEDDLTKNQALVMNALSDARSPMSAYKILDELREHGFRAPLQVYRALDKLVEIGLVHRLESLNAFVACQHSSCEGEDKQAVMFAICETCGNVQELMDNNLVKAINGLADGIGFALKRSVIELRGTCSECAEG